MFLKIYKLFKKKYLVKTWTYPVKFIIYKPLECGKIKSSLNKKSLSYTYCSTIQKLELFNLRWAFKVVVII